MIGFATASLAILQNSLNVARNCTIPTMTVARFSSTACEPEARKMDTVLKMMALTPHHCWKNIRLTLMKRGIRTVRFR